MTTKAKVFEFVGYKQRLNEGKVEFNYKIIFEDGKSEDFVEKLYLQNPDKGIIHDSLDLILQNLLLMLGISYYKLYCPKEIKINGFSLIRAQAEFWNIVYTKGLGEFFYKNKIDFRGLVNFPYTDSTSGVELVKSDVSEHVLVPFGGGKDSIVTAQTLKERNIPFDSFTLNTSEIQQEVIKQLNINTIVVTRKLDPKIFRLNDKKEVYNGHIPITAIYSFVALLVGHLYGFSEIIMSNERSANYGNVPYLGTEINHQWSKSKEFEYLLHNYINQFITSGINYYSFLRPYFEIEVIRQFVTWPQYLSLFSSCNSNFKIRDSGRTRMTNKTKKWCGECPKCAFVFACLCAFIEHEKVVGIFGHNLFNDITVVDTFRRLVGILDVKPFECVGTPDETKVALYLAYQNKVLRNNPVMDMFQREVLSNIADIDYLKQKVLSQLIK